MSTTQFTALGQNPGEAVNTFISQDYPALKQAVMEAFNAMVPSPDLEYTVAASFEPGVSASVSVRSTA